MAQYIVLGPFDAQTFLVPPNATSNPATGSVLELEQFKLLHGDSDIGLDHIHEDRLESKALLKDGLRWRGTVLFSTDARNKKQISRLGLELLYTAAQTNLRNVRIDWSIGFKVILEGVYWRHCFVRRHSPTPAPIGTKGKGPLSCDLSIDLEPVFVERTSLSTTTLNQRRFSVISMTETFLRCSSITWVQSELILALEHIKRVKGKKAKVGSMTVAWYCARYKELYPSSPPNEDYGTPSHQTRTNSTSFYSLLASQLDSLAFCQNLVTHKRLFNKDNLAKFRRDVETIGMLPPEVPQEPETNVVEDYELQEEDLIVIEDTPSPLPPSRGDLEEVDELWQEQMDVDELAINEDLMGNPMAEHNSEWEEPMERVTIREDIIELPTTPTLEPLMARPSTMKTLGAFSLNAETLRLLPMITPALFDPPILPRDCKWVCPVTGCYALFDLKGKLPKQVLEHLTPKEIGLLKSRAFTAMSHKALDVFCVIVDVHYAQHLAKLGIMADKSKPCLKAIDVEHLG